jgi:hypothetical protein
MIFDRVIIGTSPIAMLTAIKSAQDGFKTAVLEKEGNDYIGGAWKTINVKDLGEVECACHLIEFYDGAYEIIEKISGVKFVNLEPQPCKITDNNRKLYTSVESIIVETFRVTLVFIAMILVKSINVFVPASFQIKKWNNLTLLDQWNKFILSFRYRLIGLKNFSGLKGPEGGYELFVRSMVEKLKKSGVVFHQSTLLGIEKKSIGWEMSLQSGEILKTKKITATESTIVNTIKGQNIELFDYKKKRLWHVMVGIPKTEILNTITYILLPKNDLFHRITSVFPRSVSNSNQHRSHFLVQAKVNVNEINNLQDELQKIFNQCGITESKSEIFIYEILEDEFFPPGSLIQIKRKYYDESFEVMKSIGCMARNIILNKKWWISR